MLMDWVANRIVAGILSQPGGHDPAFPVSMYDSSHDFWGPALPARRPSVTTEIIGAFLHNLYRGDFTDFVRSCEAPLLVTPDNTLWHSYEEAMEVIELAPTPSRRYSRISVKKGSGRARQKENPGAEIPLGVSTLEHDVTGSWAYRTLRGGDGYLVEVGGGAGGAVEISLGVFQKGLGVGGKF